ncbi:hypothetical protein A8F94_04380 [Bacillus sp. FJAT-27225]|uniref:MBL fold metallo-hydrolase n=1 Tax=Bacillus sp. FJAT-27225 TaxID=1743144 RepID=UPI00080C3435|nr:MBL fold metallo-hydrolase [Bacillus sp. FJAT-27225]OCA91103.1 hypothetical protein A8F94_04380 [Bacillus sp. FJAT-27225]
MKWFPLPLGGIQANCYILHRNDGTCLIVDPGDEAKKLIRVITEKKLTPLAVILTHAHFDHIGAVDTVRDHYKIPVYLHKKEEKWLGDPALNGSAFFPVEPVKVKDADHLFKGEGEMEIAGFHFTLYETPGHSPGGVSFYFPDDGLVVAGDSLFMGSIGRTDLPGGNSKELLNSIHTKLLTLPEETIVLPGHGPATTIGDEMDSNPFLNGFGI